MKKMYNSPVCWQFLVEEELPLAVSYSAIVTPGADDLGGGEVVPPAPGIGDDPINGSDDFSKGGMMFE